MDEARRTAGRSEDPPGDPAAVARSVVLRQLTGAARTRAELEAALQRKGVPDEVAAQVLDRFTQLGYVDDAALASSWARARVADRGLGRRALAARLRQRGVDDEDVSAALDEVSAQDEEDAARRLVQRRLSGAAGRLPREVLQRRLVAMLARKGHAPGAALRVVREELDAAGATWDGSPGEDDEAYALGPPDEPDALSGLDDHAPDDAER